MSALFEFQATNTVSGGGLRALPGATATVYATGTTSRVNLFNTAGAPINNPGVTDPNGMFAFFAPEGIYDVVVQSGSLVYTQTIGIVYPPARKIIADANYVAQAGDISVGVTPLTATRTITLPPLATMGANKSFPIGDESGNASPAVQIIIVPSGADTINGHAGATLTIETPYQYVAPQARLNTWSV